MRRSKAMTTERRKLFSTTPRKKLFSGCEDNIVKTVMCMDCGYKMDTAASTSHIACPKCGGTRFNVYSIPESPQGTPEPVKVEEVVEEKSFSRKSLFGNSEIQKEFTEPINEFEEKLKEYSGKEISLDDCEKIFSISSDELIEKGYAEISENNLKISDIAFLRDKLFSKLIVSVTKVLDLDPKVLDCPKESIIDSLGQSGAVDPKGIILIKKAHMISPSPSPVMMEEDKPELGDWIKDSGIVGDMRIELGDKNDMGVEDFVKYLKSRYSDAPKGLLDYLVSNGVVKIQGNKVDVLK